MSGGVAECRRIAELPTALADALERQSEAADYGWHCLRELRVVRLVPESAIAEAGINDEAMDRYVVKWFPLAAKTMR